VARGRRRSPERIGSVRGRGIGCWSVSDTTNVQFSERREIVSQIRKAKQFGALHVKGTPVVLDSAWDAGSAKAIVDAGAAAVATSSWSVANCARV
jgi:hypothetical protein